MFEIKSRFSINNNINNDKDINDDIIFTTKMKSLLDTIHFGITTRTPIVLEGSYGQGKLKAIDYYCKLKDLSLLKLSLQNIQRMMIYLGKIYLKQLKGSKL